VLISVFFCNSLELNDHIENMIGLICKTHDLADPLSLAAVSLVSKNDCNLSGFRK